MNQAKVVKIIDADRRAGYCVEPKPPEELIGKTVHITRPLSMWAGYRCEFEGGSYVFAKEELEEVE